jgi:hypothetical protein
VVETETKNASGSGKGKSQIFVGEADGKLYVLVPAVAR